MQKIKSLINYFVWIPFAVSIGAFILYFRYLFTVKLAPNVEVTEAINLVMERYLKIGLFTLFLGLLLVFAIKISKIIFNEDKYYNSKYPWTKLDNEKEKNIVNEDNDYDKFNIENTIDSPIENNIDNIIKETNQEEDNTNDDYIIKENIESDDKIFKDLNNEEKIKARLIDDDSKNLETLDEEKVVIPETTKQTIIKVDSSKVKVDGFRHCPKCNNLVVEDAVICVHCGILLDKSFKESNINYEALYKKEKRKIFSPVKLAFDAIIILVSCLIIILLCQKIETQKEENASNLNTESTKIQDILKK